MYLSVTLYPSTIKWRRFFALRMYFRSRTTRIFSFLLPVNVLLHSSRFEPALPDFSQRTRMVPYCQLYHFFNCLNGKYHHRTQLSSSKESFSSSTVSYSLHLHQTQVSRTARLAPQNQLTNHLQLPTANEGLTCQPSHWTSSQYHLTPNATITPGPDKSMFTYNTGTQQGAVLTVLVVILVVTFLLLVEF